MGVRAGVDGKILPSPLGERVPEGLMRGRMP